MSSLLLAESLTLLLPAEFLTVSLRTGQAGPCGGARKGDRARDADPDLYATSTFHLSRCFNARATLLHAEPLTFCVCA